MNYNTQNVKIVYIVEITFLIQQTLIDGIDVGSGTHYARAFCWCNYEYSKEAVCISATMKLERLHLKARWTIQLRNHDNWK